MKFKLFTCMLLVILLVTSCGKDSEQDGSTPTPPSGRDEITLTVPELILPDSDPVGTLSFSASSDWSVSLSETKAVPDWLTVEPMSGKAGQATLTVTAQPNENYDDRSAVITIRSGTTSKSLPVYQKKKNALLLSKERYELSGEETDIDVEVKSNIDFEVKILDDWITQVQTKGLTTHQLKFHIAANELPDNREGRIVIKSKNSDLADTVHVYQSQQNSLVLNQREYSVSEEGETIDVVLKSNVDFTVQMPDVDWIEEVQTKSLQTYKYQYRILPNETYDGREAQIVFKDNNSNLADTVFIYQTTKGALLLSKDHYELEAEGGNIDVEVKSNIDFEVKILDDWITQVQTKGLTTHQLKFHIAANELPDNREGRIVIKSKNSDLADTVHVYQSQQNSLVLNQREYSVSEEGETIDVVLKSNVDFTVQMPDVDWIEEVQTKSLQTYKYQYRILPNETYDGREAQIVFKDNNSNLADTVFVYQTTKDALLLTKDRYEMGIQGGTIDVEVKSNVDFEVKILDDWITQWQTKGLETYYLWFDVQPNANNKRTGKIVFLDKNSSLTDTVYVVQLGTEEIQQDREALIALYKATNGDNWIHNDNWCTDKPLSEWYGVTVNENGRVAVLSFFQNNLTGYLPEEIGGLTEVISFDIEYNSLSGALPEGISSLMNGSYSHFLISNNEFSGQLPKSVLQHPNWKIHWAGILDLSTSGGKGFDLSNVEIPAPDFTVTDLNGLTLSSTTEYSRNKYTVFYHWATWCPFSHDFTVKLIPLYKAYHSKGLEIIGYSDVTEQNYPRDDIAAIEEYIAKQNIPWRNFAWDQDTGNMIGALWYALYTPFVAVADQNGKIVFQSVTEDYEGLFTFLSEHLGEVTIEESKPYVSTDFSADGQVVTLQRATVGKGIDLVLMGDAFVDTTMVAGGIYEQRMREGMEAFFMEEPMKSLRDRFNVHMVKVVSENGSYAEGLNTALDSYMGSGTLVGGSDSRCFDYASRVSGIDLTRSQVVVIMNVQHYAGTCYMYEDNSSVAYFPLGYDESIFDQLLNHEAVGHGFGKLLDEYSNNLGEISQYERDNYQRQKALGWGANTDVTSDPSQIRWAHFLQDSRYASEVGIYEGALTYQTGAWRPTENSIMRYNTGGFNAPSREALYKRVMELSGEGYSWERFVEYDAVNRVATKTLLQKRDLQPAVPLHVPVMIRGTWRNAQ